MHHSFRNIAVLSLCAATPALGDFLGPRYVPPVDLSSDKSEVSAAWKTVTSTLEKALSNKNANATSGIPGIDNTTFSAGMFALNDPSVSKMQFHYSAPWLAQTNGTHKVDAESIYPIASITKVFTVLTGLLNLKTSDWERSMADVFPALNEYAKRQQDDPLSTIQWDKITLDTLAAQVAGIPTNPLDLDVAVAAVTAYLSGDLTALSEVNKLGYPDVNMSLPFREAAVQGLFDQRESGVTVDNLLPTLGWRSPFFEPWVQTLYSNNGFILLTNAIHAITGKRLSALSEESVLKPLKMSSSFYNIVPDSETKRSVILSDELWNIAGGEAFEGSGGLLSTINDLTKFGTGVLNSTLMPKHATRKWMKPSSHTGRFEYAMGRPWEILRYVHTSGAITDMYTKAGDSGTAGSFLVLIPDYNVGFSVLAATADVRKLAVVGALGDVIANTMLPALEEQAAKEAEANFAGTYVSTVEGLNSSVVLCINKTEGAAPGLLVKSFISNGTDFQKSSAFYRPGSRLTPSIISEGGDKVAFRVALGVDAPSVNKARSLFSGEATANFLASGAGSYGGVAVSEWQAQVGKDGKAASISPTWLQIDLKRKE